ncbi:MAG: ABC transporter ATP-binding protein [Dehalococcoidia bacterium]|nr:ABC transporter ATP-binding protein [Dehalococcoidia bacterium]
MKSSSSLAVETKGLVKKYGAFTAVNGLNLKIERGETYGLLGPNGSGKTTAIKMFCGLLSPTSGEALVLGKKAGDLTILPRIGYMPQETALYLDLTVHENMALFGEIYGMNKAEIEREEKNLLRFVDLEERRNSTITSLSGGMRHRVSLACSMIHRPELLFLDEPTVGVDPELRASFWEYFGSLREKGVTVVITTHYMDEAHRCSKIGLMRMGSLIAEGAPSQIIQSAGAESLEDAFLKLARRERS